MKEATEPEENIGGGEIEFLVSIQWYWIDSCIYILGHMLKSFGFGTHDLSTEL